MFTPIPKPIDPRNSAMAIHQLRMMDKINAQRQTESTHQKFLALVAKAMEN